MRRNNREFVVVLRYFRSTFPKKKKIHHYWTTFRIGSVADIEGYDYLGAYTREGFRFHLHSNLPEWLYDDSVKQRSLNEAFLRAKYPRREGN